MSRRRLIRMTSRQLARWCCWALLISCFLLDASLGNVAISGGHSGHLDANGHWLFSTSEPELWLPISGFLIFQGGLVVALIRLRQPVHPYNLLS